MRECPIKCCYCFFKNEKNSDNNSTYVQLDNYFHAKNVSKTSISYNYFHKKKYGGGDMNFCRSIGNPIEAELVGTLRSGEKLYGIYNVLLIPGEF